MLIAIGLMIAVTIAIVARVLAPQLQATRYVFDSTPDRPTAFGYKMAWLAVRTRDTDRVAQALGLADLERCNWSSGIGSVYDATLGSDRIFISPPVNGWTFVVGLSLPHPVGSAFVDKSTPLLLDLGTAFAEAQYFFTFPLIDFYAWGRVINGKLVRAFAISDEGIVWNKGKATKEEKALGLKLFELRGVRGRKGDAGGEMILYPTEDHVMTIAARWSIDPTKLERNAGEPALGFIGRAPQHWRSERVRKAA